MNRFNLVVLVQIFKQVPAGIVESGNSRVVQFSCLSVKEYLTSAWLAISSGDVLRYYIALEPAHTILAQACMSALLRSDDPVEQNGVEYIPPNWLNMLLNTGPPMLSMGMYRLAYKRRWNISLNWTSHILQPGDSCTTSNWKSDAGPMYYAALCGFQDLVGHLIMVLIRKFSQHVNICGGYNVTPQLAALAGEHFQTANFFHDNGVDPNIRGFSSKTPLHSAAYYGHLQMVQELLEHKADVNAQRDSDQNPSLLVGRYFERPSSQVSQLPNISRLLLEHGADVNARTDDLSTPCIWRKNMGGSRSYVCYSSMVLV